MKRLTLNRQRDIEDIILEEYFGTLPRIVCFPYKQVIKQHTKLLFFHFLPCVSISRYIKVIFPLKLKMKLLNYQFLSQKIINLLHVILSFTLIVRFWLLSLCPFATSFILARAALISFTLDKSFPFFIILELEGSVEINFFRLYALKTRYEKD